MIFTVTTLRDDLHHAQTFVRHNLAMGVDHLFVFVDRPEEPSQGSVLAFLDEHPNVTAISTNQGWWPAPEDSLNSRQVKHANVVEHALTSTGATSAMWLFHIDSDEVLDLDLDTLPTLPETVVDLHLPPLEAVASFDSHAPATLFKRLPNATQNAELLTRGILNDKGRRRLFRGHVRGKAGIRLASDRRLGVHEPWSADWEKLAGSVVAGMHVLHHHARSGADFATKADRLSTAGAIQNPPRKARLLARAVELSKAELPPATRERKQRAHFERTLADPVDALAELGLLVEVDADLASHTPDPRARVLADAAHAVVETFRGSPKDEFIRPL